MKLSWIVALASSYSSQQQSNRNNNISHHNNVLELDAATLSQRLCDGSLTAVELMTATLDKIEEINDTLQAVILLRDREELLKEAAQADYHIEKSSSRKGWLHGIPLAVKDVSNVAGIPTTMGGSPLFQDFIPEESDPFVKRLQDAGAIIIGKTNVPESALGCHTYNTRWGTTRNPYDTFVSASGSSGGAAVAVASRMLPVADGTDMMGSLRNPAGWNNLYSIRPTAGMFENNNTLPSVHNCRSHPLEYAISTPGAIARTVQDLALFLETMAGRSKFVAPLDLTSSPKKVYHIAWLGNWGGQYPMEDDILSLCRSSLHSFAAAENNHVDVEDVEDALFPAIKLWESWTTIRSVVIADEHITAHGRQALLGDESTVKPELKWEVSRGLSMTNEELLGACAIAKEWSNVVDAVFEKYDAIALPSSQVWPFPLEWDWPKEIKGRRMDTYHRWMEVMVPASLAGLPCVTIPAGFGPTNNLPTGIQLIGRRYDDVKLLQLAQRYHQATDWPGKRPPTCASIHIKESNNF